MSRLRVRYKRGPEVKYISHLDMIRLWQRALTRAGIELAYSEGFNPHPRLSLAAPLALGVTSDAELMDVSISRYISPHSFEALAGQQLPPGIEIMQVYQIELAMPSLQSQVRYAEYLVEVDAAAGEQPVEVALASLLEKEHLPWQHRRNTAIRSYDLRPLIKNLWLAGGNGEHCTIGMRLRCDSSGSGRPEQVSKALGLGQPHSIHRTRLILKTS